MKNIKFFVLIILWGSMLQATNDPYYQHGATNLSFSPDGNYIAWSTWNQKGLFLYDLENGKIITVSNHAGAGRYFAFSPDGQKIFYKAIMRESETIIQKAIEYDIFSKKERILAASEAVGNPTQSINGIIAYTVGHTLRLVNGNTITSVELGAYSNLAPISPPGDFVIFNDDADQLWKLNLEDMSREKISPDGGSYFVPIISRSGRFVLYTKSDGTLEVKALSSGKVYNLGQGNAPAFTHDESGVVFERRLTEPYRIISSELYFYRFATESETKIAGGPEDFLGYPAISPDGSTIAFVQLETGDLILADLEPSAPGISHRRVIIRGADIPADESSEILMTPTHTLVELNVPYMHQVYDTPDYFDGNWSCGPTSCVMAVQYYNKLPNHDIICSSPYPHTSHWGWYIPNLYSYNGYTYDVWGIAPNGWFQGAHGFICRELGAAYWSYMIQFMNQHTLSSSQFSVNWSLFCDEIDAGYPVVASTTTLGYGHIQCFKGYEPNHVIISNDPFGDANRRPWGQYNGSGARYDWPGYNNGHVVLGLSALFKARGSGGGPPPPPSNIQVTITTSFGSGTVTVDGTNHSAPYTTEWSSGSTHTISVPSPQGGGSDVRYIFDRWSDGGAQSHQVSPTSSTTYTAYFRTQYRLLVQASPAQHDSPSPGYGEHWFDAGSNVNCSVSSPADESGDTRYRCTGYSGSGSCPSGSGTSVSFNINSPSTITWQWIQQFKLTVNSSPEPHDSPTPSYGAHWYDTGSTITASVTTPTDQSGWVRWRSDGWRGYGSVPGSGSGTSVSFVITQPSAITWLWVKQYYLQLTYSNTEGRVPLQAGEGWWDENSRVTISTTDTVWDGRYRYIFLYWTATPSIPIDNPQNHITTITLNQPATLDATYLIQYYCLVKKEPCHPAGELVVDRIPYYGEEQCQLWYWWDKGSVHLLSVTPRDSLPETVYIFDHWSDGLPISHNTTPLNEPFDFIAYYRKIFWCYLWKVPLQRWGSLFLEGREYPERDSLSWWAEDGQSYEIGTSPYDVGPDTLYAFRGWSDGSPEPRHISPPITEPTIFYAYYSERFYYLEVFIRNPNWFTDTLELGSTRRMSAREAIEIKNTGNIEVDFGLTLLSTPDLAWQPGAMPSFNTFSLRARFNNCLSEPAYYEPYNDLVTSNIKWANDRVFGPYGWDIPPCYSGDCTNYLYFEFKAPTGTHTYSQVIKVGVVARVSIP